ncbi:MAG TPA: hypothetical protein VKA91_04875 [Nitrososphaeraceae archaeon]|nr:hypothetical protein [Nitrososphaeraceae archaeon]
MINNLNEALQYFIKEKSKENLNLEVVKSIQDDDNHGNPMCYIIKRKDDNYYFLFYKEGFRTGFEKEFHLPGSGDEWLSLNLNVIALAAFEYNNAVIVVILSNGEIRYTRSLDVYNFSARNNTLINKLNI